MKNQLRFTMLSIILSGTFVFPSFSSYEEVEDIVRIISANSSLTAEQSQELTDKLREYEKDMLEHAARHGELRKSRTVFVRPKGVGEITPELIDIVTPYVGKNDTFIVSWLCECVDHYRNLRVARHIIAKGLVDHTNIVTQDGVPFWHQVLDGRWDPKSLDFLLDHGADLEAQHPISGNTALLDLAIPKKYASVGESFDLYTRSTDYNLSEHDVKPELEANPKFKESFEFNQKYRHYIEKLNDLYRMWYLINKGADIYAVNSKDGSTLADKIKKNLRPVTAPWNSATQLSSPWDVEDWHDLRDRMIAYKEGAQLAQLLPEALQDLIPVATLHAEIGQYVREDYDKHKPLENGDGAEKVHAFFLSVEA